MPIEGFPADEASKACFRALTKLLAGQTGRPPALTLPPMMELASAGAIFAVDPRHRIVHLNTNAAEFAGKPVDAIVGRTCRDVFRCLNCPSKCPLFGGATIKGREVVIGSMTGRRIPVLKSAEILRDESGVVVGGLEVMHDLSRLSQIGWDSDRDALGGSRGATVAGVTPDACTGAPVVHATNGMVGSCAPMRQLFERIERLARIDATVLVAGESGAGKELVARALHEAGPRSSRPFHAINCAALAEDLLESELFGHERGAFTGAVRDKPGRFEVCEDGTVLLDEIGCLPYALQSKLLRVLEDGGFERVGGTRRRHLRARVVAATNSDLDALVREGAFRADLLYRLKVCSLHVPPLRERRDDIPALANHFAHSLAASCGARAVGFSAQAMRALQDHAWPGNVRELRNVVHAALVIALDQEIRCEHLPPEIAGAATEVTAVDRGRIEEALVRTRYNRSEAALILGISRTTLWRYMRRAGIG